MSRAGDKASWRRLYPFASRELLIDGLRCHYVDEGSGQPLLLVHGNPTWSFYWRALLNGLSDSYRLVAPDQIGCGLSEKPPRSRYPYTLRRRINDLCRLIERLDMRAITLVAHDWGGAVGMGAAVEMPDRFERFVLMNTAAFPAPRCPWRIRVCRAPLLGPLAVQGLNLFARAALVMATARRAGLPAEVRDGLLAPYDSWRHRTAIYHFVRDIPLSPRHESYATLARIAARLGRFESHPFCFFWGMRDWCFTPWFLEQWLMRFPRAEVHRFDDAGHYVLEDAAERIVPALRAFLQTERSGAASLQAKPAVGGP